MKLLALVCVSATLMAVGPARADQPNMQSTLKNLEQARNNLQRATADKGGHRGKARELIDQAIAEVKAGMEYDRTHPGDAGKK
jgi:hypothetical protein